MERNTDGILSWHVTDVSLNKVVEEGCLKGVELELQIRMPVGVLGRALVSLTRNGETVTDRNLLLPGDMRMPAFPGMDKCGGEVEEKSDAEGAETFRLVTAQVFIPAGAEGFSEESNPVYGIKICLFDVDEVCREGICCPII